MVSDKKTGWIAMLILLMLSVVLAVSLTQLPASFAGELLVKSKVTAKGQNHRPPVGPQTALESPRALYPIPDKDQPLKGLASPQIEKQTHPSPKAEKGYNLAEEMVKNKNLRNSLWKLASAIYLLVLLVFLSVLLFRQAKVDEWMSEHDFKPLKPMIAVFLGAAFSFSTTWIGSDYNWLLSFIMGLMGLPTGLAAVGLHQILTRGNKEKL